MKRLVYFILFFGLSQLGYSQNVKFTADTKRVVSVGERFNLVFSVNAEGDNFNCPPITDFNVLMGPSTSSSSSVEFVNGKVNQSVSMEFTYVLEAAKEGKFSIKAAQIRVNGKVYKSNSVDIEVVKGSAPPPAQKQQQAQGQGQMNQSTMSDVSDENLFVRVTFDKTSVYEGEPIVASIKLYVKSGSGIQISNFKNYKFPSFQGFYSQAIEEPRQITMVREAVNGKVYDAGLFKKVLLYPQHGGKITIDPFSLELIYLKQVARQSFFDNGYREFSKKLESKPTIVIVKPLPEGKPTSFGGAVGSFGLSVDANTKHVKANESITLKVKINGTGNLKLAEPGKISFPTDFETYDPKISTNIKNTPTGSTGSKTLEYLIIPRHAGKFTIPAIKFSYFDPKSGKYKELSSDDIAVTVEKGNGKDQGTVVQGISKEDVRFVGSDIRFINTSNTNLSKQGLILYGSTLLWFLYLFPLLALIPIVILRRKQIQESSNMKMVKNKKANKVTRKRLKLAATYLREQKDAPFYEEIMKASWGYMSDKLGIPVSELTKDKVMDTLAGNNIDAALGERLIKLLDQCEFARFAPSSVSFSKEHLYTEAEFLINEFEKIL